MDDRRLEELVHKGFEDEYMYAWGIIDVVSNTSDVSLLRFSPGTWHEFTAQHAVPPGMSARSSSAVCTIPWPRSEPPIFVMDS